jgi:hypothetical protein
VGTPDLPHWTFPPLGRFPYSLVPRHHHLPLGEVGCAAVVSPAGSREPFPYWINPCSGRLPRPRRELSSHRGVLLFAPLPCSSFLPTMPTSSTARRATEPAAPQPGASNSPFLVPAATTDRFSSRGTSEPVDESPSGTGPVTPLQVCEARIREMAHHQQEEIFAHAELDARVARLEGELALSREIERKASDALIRCLALCNAIFPSRVVNFSINRPFYISAPTFYSWSNNTIHSRKHIGKLTPSTDLSPPPLEWAFKAF